MTPDFENLFDRIRARAESLGIQVKTERLGAETPGTFDGLSITINPDFDAEPRCYYLVHALGSIVRWSPDPGTCRALFDELHAARANRSADPDRLERAIERYRGFEEGASEYAVGILADLGYAAVIPAYTNFARADIEALVHFHRHGVAPVWREFFADWNQQVARGERIVRPYEPRAVPPFKPVPLKTQEIIREVDDA